MPTTLSAIVADPRFSLRPVGTVDAEVMSAPLPWAHSSDLPDPTPWLETGGLLLTDGAQFDGPDPAPADAYVARLAAHGIRALGFATGIVHDSIPVAVSAAARRAGLPVFDVSRDTPFMGIIRFVSDAVAVEERDRLERSLRAQRSVARAALRPDGLAAILDELERNLNCWVALFDASGARVSAATRHSIPPALEPEIAETVSSLLGRGRTAAARLSHLEVGEATLRTLGRTDALRGVLAVGAGTALDSTDVDLVDAVIALASIALDQSRTLDDARRRLRSGVLELLTAGVFGVADRTVEHLWGRLPPAPIRVGCFSVAADGAGGQDALRAALELRAAAGPTSLFFAERDEAIVAVAAADQLGAVIDLAVRHGARVGVSGTADWDGFGEAVQQARRAVSRTTARDRVAAFDDLARTGMLGHLEATRAHEVARRMLHPLAAEEAPADIAETLAVWLEHNGAWDPAARALGMHRHTLRARVETAGSLLGMDLDTFGARAELWAALQLGRTRPARRVGSVSRSAESRG